jgi:methyltransferase (TIGR00027 family)
MDVTDSVGSTALMAAAIRAAEAARPRPLFEDRFASLFAVEKISAAIGPWAAVAPVVPTLIRVRTRWFNEALERARDGGAVQVVVLGAGCCCRSLLYARPGVTFFEIDRAEVLGFKTERLAAGGHRYPAIPLAIDYTAPRLLEALAGSGLDAARRTFVIWEGNTSYLPAPAVQEVLRVFAALPDVRIAFDYFHPDAVEGRSRSPGIRTSVERLRAMGAPFQSGIDDMGALVHDLGLRVEEDRRLLSHLVQLLPELNLGDDAHAEYGLCLLAGSGDQRTATA